MIAVALAIGCSTSNAQEATGFIGKSDLTLKNDLMTPEALWAMGRIGGHQASPDGKQIVYQVSYYSVKENKSHSVIYVMDADGNLIGLAFDGNWEAMSGDVIFEPNLQRCICVDIRYVLFMLDKFGGAGYLLDEMDIVR